MIDDVTEQTLSSWRSLEDEWHRTQEVWRDQTAEYFAMHYYAALTTEFTDYLAHLEEVAQAVQHVRSVVRSE